MSTKARNKTYTKRLLRRRINAGKLNGLTKSLGALARFNYGAGAK